MDHEKIDQAAGGADATQAQVATRRRFLKGTSLALPAVMTLHSVSAQAQAMSSSSCATNFMQVPRSAVTYEPDDAFRHVVDVYDTLVRKINGTTISYEGDGIVAYFAGLEGDQAVIRDLLGNIVQNPNSLEGDPLSPSKSVNYPGNPHWVQTTNFVAPWDEANGKGHAIVLFDTDGAVAAVGNPNAVENVTMVTSLTGACLHSLWGQTV